MEYKTLSSPVNELSRKKEWFTDSHGMDEALKHAMWKKS